jgi:hypothetical protein
MFRAVDYPVDKLRKKRKTYLSNDNVNNKERTSLLKVKYNDALYKIMDTQKQNRLAMELADSLNDTESLQAYVTFTEKYSEEFLRKVLTKVLSIPENKIRKSRGALFTFLIKQNAQYTTNHSRN